MRTKILILAGALCIGIYSLSQNTPIFNGGDGTNQYINCYDQDALPSVYGVFTGGNDNGAQMTCYLESHNNTSALFQGGIDANVYHTCYEESGPFGTAMFMGGTGQSIHIDCFEEALALGSQIYNGGIDINANVYCFEQGLPPAVYAMYTGGNNDGTDLDCYEQSAPFNSEIYAGGNDNGDLYSCLIQTAPLNASIYHGGNGGNKMECYQEQDYLVELPITLINFSVEGQRSSVLLNWETASEINASHFSIQHSTNGYDFSEIATVKATGGPAMGETYELIDEHPSKGLNYYHLKLIDLDGTFAYSETVTVLYKSKIPDGFNFILYPNPAEYSVNLEFNFESQKSGRLMVVDISGKVYYQRPIMLENNLFEFTFTPEMSAGTYIVVFTDNQGQQYTQKLIVK